MNPKVVNPKAEFIGGDKAGGAVFLRRRSRPWAGRRPGTNPNPEYVRHIRIHVYDTYVYASYIRYTCHIYDARASTSPWYRQIQLGFDCLDVKGFKDVQGYLAFKKTLSPRTLR